MRFRTPLKGFRVRSTKGGFFTFTKILESTVEHSEGVAFREEPDLESRSIRIGDIKEVVIGTRAVVRLLMTLGLFVGAHSHEVHDVFQTYKLSEGSMLQGPNGVIYIREAYQQFPLIWAYNTARFSKVTNMSWWCVDSMCADEPSCKLEGPRGIWSHTKLSKEANGERTFEKNYCSNNGDTCFWGKGCWLWSLRYSLMSADEHRVYRISQSITRVVVEDRNDGDASVVSVRLQDPFSPALMSIVRTSFGQDFLCPMDSRQFTPRAGTLGDLQYNDEGSFILANDVTECQASWIKGPKCDSTAPFVSQMSKICNLLPMQYGAYKLEIKQGLLRATKDSNVMVTLHGTDRLNWTTVSGGCGTIKMSVWGIKGGHQPYQLIATSSGCNHQSEMEIRLPCTGEEVMLKCDCKPHVFEIQSPTFCRESLSGINITELTQEEVDLAKTSAVTGIHFDGSGSFFSFLDGLGGSFPVLGGIFGGNVIIIIIIIVLIMRK